MRRRLRYKHHPTVALDEIRDRLQTGDIILFHKTARTGLFDTLELDFVAPLFFERNEFRHSGIVVRRDDGLFVIECTEEFHSGHVHARYITGGKGIREVSLELLLEEYARDNGDPHFGVRLIGREISADALIEIVQEIGPVSYLKASRSVPIYLSKYLLPRPAVQRIIDRYANQMMCSEFVHYVLARCGALRDYQSKLFAPYIIENHSLFARYDIGGYSDIVRFTRG
ncbi:MAG TPA: hypothetical protein VFT21_06170 [Gemmatimonadaceae bacterium]|nr:hypothetical protein [Gemmatimonadaceae bacterium]